MGHFSQQCIIWSTINLSSLLSFHAWKFHKAIKSRQLLYYFESFYRKLSCIFWRTWLWSNKHGLDHHHRGDTETPSATCCSGTVEAACRGSSAGGRAPGRRRWRSRQRLLLLKGPRHQEVRGETNPGISGVTLTRLGWRELQKLHGISTNHVCTQFFTTI